MRCEDIRQKPLYPLEITFLFNHGRLGEKFIKPLHEAAMLVEPEVRLAGLRDWLSRMPLNILSTTRYRELPGTFLQNFVNAPRSSAVTPLDWV